MGAPISKIYGTRYKAKILPSNTSMMIFCSLHLLYFIQFLPSAHPSPRCYSSWGESSPVSPCSSCCGRPQSTIFWRTSWPTGYGLHVWPDNDLLDLKETKNELIWSWSRNWLYFCRLLSSPLRILINPMAIHHFHSPLTAGHFRRALTLPPPLSLHLYLEPLVLDLLWSLKTAGKVLGRLFYLLNWNF